MSIVDLSHPIATGMPVYPGDPDVSVESALSIAHHGSNVARLQLGSHTGTHLDAPSHVVAGGRTVDQLDLELLHGIAHILQVTQPPETFIGQSVRVDDIAALPEQLPPIVCIATGWDQHFYDAQQEHHPHIDPQLAQSLWERGARVLGVDTLSPDPTAAGTDYPVHEFWLGHDGIIIENLRALTELPDQVKMSVLPLNLAGLDGSPVRAIARQQ